MASKQMEEIQRKLSLLEYPRANAPAQSLLFAGVERYRLLEWLFFRYAPAHPRRISFPLRSSGSCDLSAGFGLRFRDSGRELTVCWFGVCVPEAPGDRSPFTQQNWQGDSLDRDEENNRIQRKVLVSSLG